MYSALQRWTICPMFRYMQCRQPSVATVHSNRERIEMRSRCKVSSCERRAGVHLAVDLAAECWQNMPKSLRRVVQVQSRDSNFVLPPL